MKSNFCKIYKILILFTLIFSLFSCNNSILDLSESEYGNVSFSINGYDSSSRTIIPMSADKENLFFTLTGAIGESVETVLKTTNDVPVDKMAYSDFKDASFRLSSGKWHFTLTGYDSNSESAVKLISGKAIDVTIGEGKNSVTFDMTPEVGGVGSISVVLNYNLGSDTESRITYIQAKLAEIDGPEEVVAEWPSAASKPELSVSDPDASDGMIVYNKKDVTSGTYFLTFIVTTKNSVNNQTCEGYRSDVVIVATGSESFDESTIELRQKYSITYKNEDETEVTWKSGYSAPAYYSPYELTTLPVSSNLEKEDASFIGWFTLNNASKTTTDLNMTGPVTYYAHWQDKDLYVSASGSDSNTGTQSSPFATVAKALSVIANASSPLNWVINISGAIEEDVKITSTNASSITISGVTGSSADSIKGSTSTIMASAATIPVILKKITILGGEGTEVDSVKSGGGVFVNASGASVAIADDVIVTAGTAGSPVYGGGVYVSNGLVTLAGGSIQNNTAQKGGGVYIGSAGTFELTSGTIKENIASYTTSGGNNGGEGGGVYNASGTFTMSGGSITKNKAGSVVTSKRAGDGGGLYNASNGNVNITGGTIGETIASVTSSDCANYANRNGGGIYNEGTLTLNSCLVVGNYAQTGSGVYTTVALTSAEQGLISGNYDLTDEYYLKDN